MRYPGIMAIVALCAVGDASALELAEVLQSSAIEPPARVRFQEQRYNRLFSEPLQLAGFLEYPVAGELRKVVESPFEEVFTVTADRIEISRQGETKQVPLSQSRVLRQLFAGLEAILAGNTGRIEQDFRWTLDGDADDWTLLLVPRSRRVAKHLAGITVTGDISAVRAIRTNLSDEEWQVLTISPIDDET